MPKRKPPYVSGQAAGRHATWVECDGHKFPSVRERDRYLHLKILERAGRIERLTLQPRFPVVIDNEHVYLSPPGTRGRRPLTYVADFSYFDRLTDKRVIEDVKGVRTKEFLIKRALAEAVYKIKITEV
ncbi:DUF1064 domain-containing protein [Azospirillum sp. sgz301742]